MPGLKRVSFELFENYIASSVSECHTETDGRKARLLRRMFAEDLTAKQRQYLLMHYRDGLSCAEIARGFGVDRSAVAKTVTRGKKRLAKAMGYMELRKDFLKYADK